MQLLKRISLIIMGLFFVSSATTQNFSFIYDGLLRTYIVHLPPNYDENTVYPMVINMHGLGSNAFQQQLYSQFDKVADTAGIIVVYPNGINNQWNVSTDAGIDDVGFISALIDTMAANYTPDLDKVYATGMSMGGFMSHRLGCQLNDRIAAIGSVTGTLAYPYCEPERSFPVLQIHGTDDPTVPYALVPITMGIWIGQNNCLDTTIIDLPDIDTTDQSTVTKSIYSPCDDDVEVILYTINGGEHTWPGAPILIGVTNYDIDASVEIWNFFRQYTLPDGVGLRENLFAQEKIFIYPQPVVNNAVVELPFENSQLWQMKLYDFSGRLIRTDNAGVGKKLSFIRNGLKSGMYIIELSSGKFVYRDKIIVR